MDIVVNADGQVRCLYDERLDLAVLGPLTITRASHVEPDEEGRWWADLTPVDGPRLGPFPKRSEALRAEVEWLTDHRLAASDHHQA